MKTYAYIAFAAILVFFVVFSYHIGKQSVLHRLVSDKVEVLKDGQKVDAAVYAADDDGLICLLISCEDN